MDVQSTVAYVSHIFPALTESFVYREVFALQERGFNIETFAIWKPDKDKLSLESRHLVDHTFYVFPLRRLDFVRAHLHFLFTRPARYVKTLFFVLTRKGESFQHRKRTFYHFCEAIYMAREMERLNVEHIHAHFAINAAAIALVISRLLDISYSFTAHNSFFIDRVLLAEKVQGARFISVISEFSRQFLMDLVPGGEEQGEKMHIIRCGLAPDDFVPPEVRPDNDVPLILFVAQLAERKGAPFLVEASRILAERGVAFRCALIGDGPEKPIVDHLVEIYDLQASFELPGAVFQEDLRPYLERADIFALPCVTARNNDVDGIPVSLMEAMAMEIATVSTDVSGIPELIEDGESGLLAPEKDAEALADALQQLLEDEALRRTLGQNGRRRIVEEFNIYKSAAKLGDLFESYL
ncbi:MAG: glycosyltransferase [Chloroflexi bacterium]|jgi:glycosyltransferase involved in cell wall biosynthesis|nr:glycosyltransferase [Chloroflexota bacterium]